MRVHAKASMLRREACTEDVSSSCATHCANSERGLLLPLPTYVLKRVFALRVRALPTHVLGVALPVAIKVALEVALTANANAIY